MVSNKSNGLYHKKNESIRESAISIFLFFFGKISIFFNQYLKTRRQIRPSDFLPLLNHLLHATVIRNWQVEKIIYEENG